uniref:Uncharacterized protein n=1 Tax=Lepeophtheirus salmonis TaxID=72036 RepID=A0A0K2VFF4_LEPSM
MKSFSTLPASLPN